MTNLNSKIEWTDSSWNIVTGCTKVSLGCDHCYAEKLTERFHGKGSFANVKLHHDRLDAPLHWRKPRRVFVNSMADLFHDAVPSAFIAHAFDVMRETPHITYQILTKRHGRMRSLMKTAVPGEGWPVPNVHLGVSVEDQERADLRIPVLVDTSASVRFLSCEPLLAPVDLAGRGWLPVSENDPDPDAECVTCGTEEFSDCQGHPVIHRCGSRNSDPCEVTRGDCVLEGDETGAWCDGPIRDYPHIAWVIIGGESGPGARPCDPEWIRFIVKQCQSAGVPVFVKQLGTVWARRNGADSKGGNPDYWPKDLRIREFPRTVAS